jgi:hypothetical protein
MCDAGISIWMPDETYWETVKGQYRKSRIFVRATGDLKEGPGLTNTPDQGALS